MVAPDAKRHDRGVPDSERHTSCRLAVLRTPTDTLLFDTVLDVVLADPDVRLAGEARSLDELISWGRGVDVAVVADELCGPEGVARMLRVPTPRTLILLAPRSGSAVVHQLQPQHVVLDHVSLAELHAVVRDGIDAVARRAVR